jgi:hypothetical protein
VFHRNHKEESPSIGTWLASFEGTLPQNAAMALHISLAKLSARTNPFSAECSNFFSTVYPHIIIDIVLLALHHLLIVRSYLSANASLWRWSHAIMHGAESSKFSLPIEIWEEIVKWLPHCDLRTLLFVPHPIRAVASEQFWREITLRFDIFSDTMGMEDLEIFHVRRSFGIMTKILRDPKFAHRVRALKVCVGHYGHPALFACDRRSDETSKMGENIVWIINITQLKAFRMCNSSFFKSIVQIGWIEII